VVSVVHDLFHIENRAKHFEADKALKSNDLRLALETAQDFLA
jgi:hypothetical protein